MRAEQSDAEQPAAVHTAWLAAGAAQLPLQAAGAGAACASCASRHQALLLSALWAQMLHEPVQLSPSLQAPAAQSCRLLRAQQSWH